MSLKIALPGNDVKTAAPEQLALDANFDSLKLPISVTNPNFGELDVTFNDNPATGTYPLFTFHYPYSYRPLYYWFFDVAKSSGILSTNTGMETAVTFALDALFAQTLQVTDISGGFTFSYIATSTNVNPTGNTYSFRYFVFANDGTP